MPSVSLPDDASLEQLRKQAKDVRDLAARGRARSPESGRRVSFLEGRARGHAERRAARSRPAQRVRVLGAAEAAPGDNRACTAGPPTRSTRPPERRMSSWRSPACGSAATTSPPAGNERPAWLEAHPELTRSSIYVAAASRGRVHRSGRRFSRQTRLWPAARAARTGGVAAVPGERLAMTRDQRGSHAWYAARALLEHGGDPNALLPLARPVPAVHGGDLRAGQPRRGRASARAPALAELLLTAGADANDGQLLYDRQFGRDDRHLVLLFEHGLGRGDGAGCNAVQRRAADSPRETCCAGSCGG